MNEAPDTRPFHYPRWLPVAGILLTLGIFGGAVYLVTLQLRQSLREQMLEREGDILEAAASLLMATETEGLAGPNLDVPAVQMNVVLKASRLRGVIAVRLYDARGRFMVAFPRDVLPLELAPEEARQLSRLQPVCRFHEKVSWERFLLPGASSENGHTSPPAPLVEVFLPLHAPGQKILQGSAQLFMDGRDLAAAYARLDLSLLGQSGAVFLVGGLIIGAGLSWAFQRLRRAHQQLQERSLLLARANQELALMAKTAAVGTVATHLIHGLKSPLSGLSHLLSARVAGEAAGADPAMRLALETTSALRQQINQIMRLLRGEGAWPGPETWLSEVIERLKEQMAPIAEGMHVGLRIEQGADACLSSRDASLVLLILENLVRNAIEASAAGKEVWLRVSLSPAAELVCEVRDQGPGFPPAQQASPFAPCQSSKPGGSGIGLAISKQLADNLGLTLSLVATGGTGSVLELRLPPAVARIRHRNDLGRQVSQVRS